MTEHDARILIEQAAHLLYRDVRRSRQTRSRVGELDREQRLDLFRAAPASRRRRYLARLAGDDAARGVFDCIANPPTAVPGEPGKEHHHHARSV